MAQLGGVQDPENQRESEEVRKRLIADITAGNATIRQICDYSKMDQTDRKALYASRIRLALILRDKGWASDEAEDALTRNGFKTTDTIRAIRSRKVRFETFYQIWETPPESVRADKGRQIIEEAEWPWRGKLSNLADALNVSPAALLGVAEPVRALTSSPSPQNSDVHDMLDDLLGEE